MARDKKTTIEDAGKYFGSQCRLLYAIGIYESDTNRVTSIIRALKTGKRKLPEKRWKELDEYAARGRKCDRFEASTFDKSTF